MANRAGERTWEARRVGRPLATRALKTPASCRGLWSRTRGLNNGKQRRRGERTLIERRYKRPRGYRDGNELGYGGGWRCTSRKRKKRKEETQTDHKEK